LGADSTRSDSLWLGAFKYSDPLNFLKAENELDDRLEKEVHPHAA